MHHSSHTSTRLTRSTDGVFAGVCEGLGLHYGISPNVLRLAWVAGVIFFGTGILVYLAMWWIVPREDRVPVDPVVWRRLQNGRHAAPLQRPVNDRKLLGVCGALARSWEVDPSLVRLAVLSLATLSFGIVAVVYLVAAFFIPSADRPADPTPSPVEL